MNTRTVTLNEMQRRRIEEVIAAGRFRSASEYLDHLIQRDADRQQGYRHLAQLIQQAEDSGEAIEATPETLDRLRSQMMTAARRAANGG